ncbi:Proline--tRNA ligase [Candidatus Cyrtobacter comes]|uniref:Proline--tRNA ligase n=1 Tax=Candidatus Cyrtobacter comes TaxID=675776 RepID=A0ABU5L6E7_9RICK|nr:proline--tRNA ligase [Candidatus Cyrtobacter comes]MDZ5761704.1 Proline--tRNA ligase [Candidatus Cyrtobacter comes]
MLLSKYFLPTLKHDPSGAHIASHKLMLRAGMIRQISTGIYSWLPLGVKILSKITNIVKKRMEEIGALEVMLPLVQPAQLWRDSGRFCEGKGLGGEMLCAKDSSGQEMLIAPSAEEVASYVTLQNIQSYKELPKVIYQVSWKFRDEIRPRHGVMRCREFLMKDAYSFHHNLDCAQNWYERFLNAYLRIYRDMGLQAIPVLADSGDMGGELNHEFHVLSSQGESTIYYNESIISAIEKEISLQDLGKFYAVSSDVLDENKKEGLIKCTSVEVGHIFIQGDKYTQNHKIQNEQGVLFSPITCAYGVGISRIIGLIIENNHDTNGIIWPKEVAPFDLYVTSLRNSDEKCKEMFYRLKAMLDETGLQVLYDDLDDSAGSKFSRADLLGMPVQIIISPRNSTSNSLEVKDRKTGEVNIISIDRILDWVKAC